MRDYDDLPYIVIERRSGGFGAFVWGALIGAAAGLLLAPRSGEQTQEEIRRSVHRVRTAAEDRVEEARQTVSRARARLDDQIGAVREQVGAARDQLDTRTEQARDAFESGRKAAREARAELERRVADVKESVADVAHRASGTDTTEPTVDVIVVEVTEERIEGRPDLG